MTCKYTVLCRTQVNNQPIELTNNKILEQKLNYLYRNPIKEGFVNEEYEYKYSSAIDYAGGRGLIKV